MSSSRVYRLGTLYPREGFVQQALEAHFERLGYRATTLGSADYACKHPNGECWLVEAKGETADIGLDFRTGLGQLLQRMNDPSVKHGLAVPDIPQFTRQLRAVPAWVRQQLRIHWLIVSESGDVRVIVPDEEP